MEVLKEIFNFVLNLGGPVFVPLIMLIIALVAGLSFKKSFIAAITLGVAFSGMNLVVNYMQEIIAPAGKAMSKALGVTLNAVDAGWTGVAAITWSYKVAFLFFPLLLAINFVMLTFNWTKTLNVDMWNVWNKIFTYVIVYYFTNNMFLGFIVASIQIIFELKIGDVWQRHIEDMTGMEGVTVPHFITLFAVILNPINKLLDYIPIFNKPFDSEAIQKKIGIFGENKVMGFIIGILLGFGAGYGLSKSLMLAIQAATAMTLFPMISKLFMEALNPIADAMSNFMKKHFKDRQVYIGLDWPILAGRSEFWVTVIVLVPVELLFAIILPNNNILPFAGIINLSFAVAALLLTGANLLRMIVLGIISTPIFLYGGTYFAPMITKLAVQTGSFKVPAGQQLSWSTIEGPDFRLLFGQAFAGQWWAVVAAVIWKVLFIWLYKDQQKIALPSKRYATLAGVTTTSTVAPKASANYQDIDLNALDGMHIGDKKKVNDYQNIDLNALDGMNFSQKKKVK
ncbi:PTS galactitol transporter subunit IIC [Ligilactobacillus animalis]|uniref:PTS galactitol transporter subunit IIC n=1 Tax=Ligilactobacillus animalis TaxID=1605 RepID=UPI0011DCCD7B|nr:PTS transporter subunit IIC [Ligilactobacillus animalis]